MEKTRSSCRGLIPKPGSPWPKSGHQEEERHHLQKVLEGCTPMGQLSLRQTTELEPSSAPGLSSSPGDSALADLPLGSRKSTWLHQLCYSGHGAGWCPLQALQEPREGRVPAGDGSAPAAPALRGQAPAMPARAPKHRLLPGPLALCLSADTTPNAP